MPVATISLVGVVLILAVAALAIFIVSRLFGWFR